MKPKDIDLAICEWTKDTGYSLTEHQLTTLTASIFNAFWSDGHVHTMPNDGTHLETHLCWCHPVLNFKNKQEQWVHTDTRDGSLN